MGQLKLRGLNSGDMSESVNYAKPTLSSRRVLVTPSRLVPSEPYCCYPIFYGIVIFCTIGRFLGKMLMPSL